MDSSMDISPGESHSKMQMFSSLSPFGVGCIKKFSLNIGGQMVYVYWYLFERKGLFIFYLRNLDKVKSRLQTEGSKTKSRFLNLKFLKDKCEDLRIRIKTVVVSRKNYLT